MDQQLFSTDVHRFLRANCGPREPIERAIPVTRARAFQRLMFDSGLAGLTWPVELGGRGLAPSYQRLFDDIAEHYDLPTSVLTLALRVCGPAVMEFGTTEQRREHAVPTLEGDRIWCQLWSEPEAGSDLGSAKSSAVRTSDGWTARGHKIWTSQAHFADYGLLLARTDPDTVNYKGLSMFVVPMDIPGMRIEPIVQSTGEAEFNEVWMDDIRLPSNSLLGEEGRGWDVVLWMMGRERTSVGMSLRSSKTFTWTQVLHLASQREILSDPFMRRDLLQLRTLHRAADALRLRTIQQIESGSATPALASATKLLEAELISTAAELAASIAGVPGTAWLPDDVDGSEVADAQVKAPSFAIGGGTTEIQLNTLAEQVLGLPREPRLHVL